jgi:hypothetical protein
MRVTHTNPHVPEQKAYTCVPPPYVKFYTETFRQHGWFCTNYGKSDTQFESHFDLAPLTAWDLQGWGSEEAPVHWRRRAPGQPFFSVYNFPSTHESRMWPAGTRPVTHAPRLIPHGPHHDGLAPLADGAVLRGPVYLEWHCFSQGASIGYRWRDDAPGRWRLAGPRLRLEPGRQEIAFKAVRTGHAESPETALSFEVV